MSRIDVEDFIAPQGALGGLVFFKVGSRLFVHLLIDFEYVVVLPPSVTVFYSVALWCSAL